MDTAAFATWLGGIGLLDPAQRAEAFRELALAEADDPIDPSAHAADAAVLPCEAAVAPSLPVAETDDAAPEEDLLSKVGRGRIARFGCPHCGRDDVRPWGKAGGKPRYRCTSCRKTFNPLTGTPLAGLHHRDRWPDQAQALIAGETVAKAAERCKVAYTTAFRWRHRFLSALNLDKPLCLSGIVEADETFILKSFKGKRRDLPRASRKRGGKAAKRGLSAEQIPSHRRPRSHRRDHRCRPAAARRRQHHGRARAGHHPASGTVLRWGCGDHRLRSTRPGQVPCLGRVAQPLLAFAPTDPTVRRYRQWALQKGPEAGRSLLPCLVDHGFREGEGSQQLAVGRPVHAALLAAFAERFAPLPDDAVLEHAH